MVYLIDKDALVMEIERRISLLKKEKKIEKWSAGASQMNVISLGARIAMLEEIPSFIGTLEVKEVDLNEEIEKCLKWYSMLAVGKKDFTDIAKHFFELGLKAAQKGEEV